MNVFYWLGAYLIFVLGLLLNGTGLPLALLGPLIIPYAIVNFIRAALSGDIDLWQLLLNS